MVYMATGAWLNGAPVNILWWSMDFAEIPSYPIGKLIFISVPLWPFVLIFYIHWEIAYASWTIKSRYLSRRFRVIQFIDYVKKNFFFRGEKEPQEFYLRLRDLGGYINLPEGFTVYVSGTIRKQTGIKKKKNWRSNYNIFVRAPVPRRLYAAFQKSWSILKMIAIR